MDQNIYISASSIYSFDCCDGLVISRLKSPRLKLDLSYLEKGKIVHSLFETFNDNTELSNSIETLAEEYEDIEDIKSLFESRDYFPFISSDFKEIRFELDNFFENPSFILSGRTDSGAVFHDKKLIVIIDFKTSREVSQKDIEQLKTYIILINAIKEKINPIYKNYRVEGLLDYIVINELLPVRLSENQIRVYESKIKNIVQTTLTKILKYLDKVDDISIEYNYGSHCSLCPSKGTCPVFKTISEATSVYLYGPNVENNIQTIIDEYNTLYKFNKIISARLESLKSSIEIKDFNTKHKDVKISYRKNTKIVPELFKEKILDYADTNKLDYRNIFIDISNDLIKPITQKNIKNKIPTYLIDAFAESKNIKSITRSISIVDTEKDEFNTLSDFY